MLQLNHPSQGNPAAGGRKAALVDLEAALLAALLQHMEVASERLLRLRFCCPAVKDADTIDESNLSEEVVPHLGVFRVCDSYPQVCMHVSNGQKPSLQQPLQVRVGCITITYKCRPLRKEQSNWRPS